MAQEAETQSPISAEAEALGKMGKVAAGTSEPQPNPAPAATSAAPEPPPEPKRVPTEEDFNQALATIRDSSGGIKAFGEAMDVLRRYPGYIPKPGRAAPVRKEAEAPPPSPMRLMKKLASIMSDLNWVEKRGRNTHFNYDYATESDILAAIRPRLAESGIFVQTIVLEEGKTATGKQEGQQAKKDVFLWKVKLLHVFHDSDSGETMDVVGIGYSEDSSDKGFYKAYTGAVKYTFSKQFLISSGDDPEHEEPGKKDARKAKAQDGEGQANPQRTGAAVQPGENGIFFVTSSFEDVELGKASGNRTQWKFFVPNVGKASTLSKPLAEKLMREKGTGGLIRWGLKRAGSFINLESAEIIPPHSVQYEDGQAPPPDDEGQPPPRGRW